MTLLEKVFDSYVRQHGYVFESEYKFHPTRKWRFDFADIKNKIAVELEGGIWINGAHNRGAHYRSDTIKYNQATVLGWKILRYCNQDDIAEFFLKDYTSLINGNRKKTDTK